MSKSLTGKIKTPEHIFNNMIANEVYEYKIIKPDNTIEMITNMKRFCRNNNLHSAAMFRIAKGKQKQHKGYKCEKLGPKPK